MGRIKGDQRGSLVRIGRKYYGRFSKWVLTGNQAEWKAVKEPLCATSEGKARAIELLNARVSEANGPAAVLLGNATVKQFVETKFQPEHIDRKKASGRDHYEWALFHILPALGDFRLAQVSQGILQGFIDAKVESGLSPQSVRHLRNALSAIWKHALKTGCYRGMPPTQYLMTPAVPSVTTRTALTAVQARALLAQMREPYRTLALVVMSCGLRIGEALALDWEHVDLERRVVRIRRNFTHGAFGTLKTLRSVRDLPLSEEAAAALKILYDNPPKGACKPDAVKDTGLPSKAGDDSSLLRQPDIDTDRKSGGGLGCLLAGKKESSARSDNHSDVAAKDNVDPKSAWPRLVFAGRYGQPLDAHNIAARELKPACKAAGVPAIGWHVLRHTAITLIQQAGATGVEAQRFAGHASDAMRERYTHAEVDRLRASVDAVRLVEELGKGRLM